MNVGNLVPVVNWLLLDADNNDNDDSSSNSNNNGRKDSSIMWPGDSKSDLLSITINEDERYIETRWNMIGSFNKLLWKPKIDVIGRTKFWYREEEVITTNNADDGESKDDDNDNNIENGKEKRTIAYQVYFYDEMWEVPAGLALLQLITPAGTIANTTATMQ